MDSRKIIQLLHRLEEQYPVDSWQLNGIDVWPTLRIKLYFELTFDSAELAFERRPVSPLKRAGKLALSFLRTYFDQLRSGPRRLQKSVGPAAVFFYSSPAYDRLGGKLFHRVMDPVRSYLQSQGIATQGIAFFPPVRGPKTNSIYFDRGFLPASIRAKLQSRECSGCAATTLRSFSEFVEDLRRTCPALAFNPALYVEKKSVEIAALQRHFMRLLQTSGAQVAFFEDYYDTLGFALSAACRALNIRAADLQHGLQVAEHAAYGKWSRLPPGGYNIFPHSFICWSESERELISSWYTQPSDQHVIVTGHPYHEFLAQDTSTALPGVGEKSVLLTLQYGLGLKEIFREFIRQAPAEWSLLCRLHPLMSDDERTEIKSAALSLRPSLAATWEPANTLPLPLLLRKTRLHLTLNSSTVLEAESSGVKSLILDATGAEYFRAQIEKGSAIYCADSQTALRSARSIMEGTEPPVAIARPDGAPKISRLLGLFHGKINSDANH